MPVILLAAAAVGVFTLVDRTGEAPRPAAGSPIMLEALSPYVKLQPGETAFAGAPPLQAPRGGFAALQVAVAPLASGALLQATAGDLTGPGGAVLKAEDVHVSAERTVTVRKPSEAVRDGLLGPVPDPLVPPSSAQVDAHGRVLLFVRIDVPRDLPAGNYSGRLEVASGGRSGALDLALEVADVQIGTADAIGTYFLVWPDKADEAEGRKGASIEYRRLLTADGIADGIDGDFVDLGGPRDGEALDAAAKRLAARAATLRAERPGVRLVSYAYDEPDAGTFDDVQAWGRALRAADPGIEQLVTSPPEEEFRDATGIISMHLHALRPDVPAQVRDLGAEPWSYSSCCERPGAPTMLLDDVATAALAVGPATWQQGGRGLLYWGVSVFDHNPWEQASQPIDEPDRVGNGDGVLLYPGKPVGLPGPVPSLRLELVRAGLQLTALAEVLERRGRGEEARTILAKVLPGTARYDRDPAAWESAASDLLAAAAKP